MNHGCVMLLSTSISAVPVLPATSMPSSAPAVPVPSSTTLLIIPASSSAVDFFITRAASWGLMRCTVRPSGSTILLVNRGLTRTPPLATVAATEAICSGVTASLSWPIAMRPTSIWFEVGPSRRPRLEYSPDARFWSFG